MRAVGLALLVFVIDAAPRWVGACEPPSQFGGFVMNELPSGDVTAPSAVTTSSPVVFHDHDNDGGGCGSSKCGFTPSTIRFDVSATDDRTASDQIGFRISLAGGAPPASLQIPDYVVRPESRTTLELWFFEQPSPAFSFDLEIRAIDRDGNEGPASTVHVEDPGND